MCARKTIEIWCSLKHVETVQEIKLTFICGKFILIFIDKENLNHVKLLAFHPLNLLSRQSDSVQEVNGRSISAGSFNHPLDLRSSFPVSHIHGPFEILLLTTTLQMLNLTFYEHPLFHKFVYELMKDL